MAYSHILLVAALALGLADAEVPLKMDEPEQASGGTHFEGIRHTPKAKQEKCQRMVETLKNDGEGAAYLGKIHIGNQELTQVIWDTGSDQQVLNSVRTMNLRRPCMTLPDSDNHCYNAFSSSDYERVDDVPRAVQYGSGDTMVLTGQDTIGLTGGKCLVQHMPFYELMATDISPILAHSLDVVAGLAPNQFKGITLVGEMGMERFSVCFNKDTSKDGYMYWNDHAPADQTGFNFWSAPVSGAANYWSVKVNNFAMASDGKKDVIGCETEEGCMAIVDTGTSLITLDKATLNKLEKHVEQFDEEHHECNEHTLAKFPTLNMEIDGNELVLRPEDYIMYTEVAESQMPQQFKDTRAFWLQKYPKLGNFFENMKGEKQCVLMFTEPIADRVMILGMPTFRNYFVTFDRSDKKVHFAKHDGNCKAPSTSLRVKRNVQKLQRIDVSKLRYSNAYHTLYKKELKLRQQRELELSQKK